MGLYTTDAIVLRRYLYRETSVIVTCLTEQYGKIKGLVKGLRTPASRHRSAMEALTINRLVFYDTRTSQLHLISQCELLDGLPQIQQELERAQTAAFFVELVYESGGTYPFKFTTDVSVNPDIVNYDMDELIRSGAKLELK